jgi:hypothetical protein
LTGRILAERLVQAANGGVRVRLLVDDMTLTGRDAAAAAMDTHPNIETRVFNPVSGGSEVAKIVPHAGVRPRCVPKSRLDRELACRKAIPGMLSITAIGQDRYLGRQRDRHGLLFGSASLLARVQG